MIIAALYARVSTKDKGQSTENQLPELRRFAQAHGYTVYKEYVEHESGGTGKRSEFQALFADAHQRRFDLVLFWSLDRFSREGALPTLQYLNCKAGEWAINHSRSNTWTQSGSFRKLSFLSWLLWPNRNACALASVPRRAWLGVGQRVHK
jgi:predicted site-specific integrase-resolvase